MNNVSIKIILAILLVLCLADMPYGYFQVVRYASLVGFAYLAYTSFKKGFQTEMFIYAALALLFQPFYKIVLTREFWNTLDIIVAVGLLISILVDRKRK